MGVRVLLEQFHSNTDTSLILYILIRVSHIHIYYNITKIADGPCIVTLQIYVCTYHITHIYIYTHTYIQYMYLYVYKGDAYINRSIRIYKLRAITFGIKTIAKETKEIE